MWEVHYKFHGVPNPMGGDMAVEQVHQRYSFQAMLCYDVSVRGKTWETCRQPYPKGLDQVCSRELETRGTSVCVLYTETCPAQAFGRGCGHVRPKRQPVWQASVAVINLQWQETTPLQVKSSFIL